MWMMEGLLKCPHCGTRLEEWDPKEGGNRRAYIPQVYSCPGCSSSGDALEAATKSAKATGGSHGLRVRLVPEYIVNYRVKTRTPEERARLAMREKERIELERGSRPDDTPVPRKVASLGGSRRPPPISGKNPLSEPSPETADTE